MELSETLLALRRGKGLSQEQLAEELNVSRQAISKWETGQSVPDLDKLVQLSRVFAVSIDELLGNAPKDAQPTTEEPDEKPEKAPPILFSLREDKWFPTCWHTMVWGILLATVTCFLTFVMESVESSLYQESSPPLRYLEEFPLNAMLWLSAALVLLGALGVGYCIFCAERQRRTERKKSGNDSTGC